MTNKFYLIDDIIPISECEEVYNGLINSNVWNLNRSSKSKDAIGTFPGFDVCSDGKTNNLFWKGYFVSVLHRIKNEFYKKYNFSLPDNLIRIALGAKNNSVETDFHCDMRLHNAFTIVGFILPKWDSSWGGSINVEGEEISIKPGRFLIFKTNTIHNGKSPNFSIPIWRISVNFVIQD